MNSKNPLVVPIYCGVALLAVIAAILGYRQWTLAAIREDVKAALPGVNLLGTPEERLKDSIEFHQQVIDGLRETAERNETTELNRIAEQRATGLYEEASLKENEASARNDRKKLEKEIGEMEKELAKLKAKQKP